jgi:GNAT superfamily N-acetyltransferase
MLDDKADEMLGQTLEVAVSGSCRNEVHSQLRIDGGGTGRGQERPLFKERSEQVEESALSLAHSSRLRRASLARSPPWLCDNLRNQDKIDRYKKCFASLVADSHPVTSSVEHDILLRRTTLQDAVEAVSNWTRFPPPFEELSHIFGLYEDQRLIGFSILDVQPKHQAYGKAEFYIAIDKDYQRRGFGEILANYTVSQARNANLDVFLRIRKNHPGGALYERCSFAYVVDGAGKRVEVVDTVNNRNVPFLVMTLRSKREKGHQASA